MFCFHFITPVLKSSENNSFLLFEKNIVSLSKTRSEFFREKEVSLVRIYQHLNYAVKYLSLFFRKIFCILAKKP